VRSAAAVGASALALTSAGDLFVLGAALGLAAGELFSVLVAAIVCAATVVHFGTTGLSAVSGAQAVLGPAGFVGPPAAAASAWTGAAALVLAPTRLAAAIPFGLAAGLLVAGPAYHRPADLGLRAVAAGVAVAVAVGLALLRSRWWRRSWEWVALAPALAALGLAVWGWRP
jgi:energy-converting hydrogenase Eha subunit A